MTELTEEEKLDLQNNLYKLYIRFKKIKRKNDFNLNDIKRVVMFYRTFFWNDDYDDEDFTSFCNMEDNQFDFYGHLKFLPREEVEKMDREYHELDRQLVFKSIDNLSNKYFIFDYLVRLDVTGLVKTGIFKGNSIIISKSNDNYIIGLYNSETQQKKQFTFKTEKEVEKFFRENDMIVKWES